MVPLAAVLVMAGGPAVFAAHARCQDRAAEELARQKAAQQTRSVSQSDRSASSETSPTQRPAEPRSNESGATASFVAAGTAKPIDTHGASHALRPADSVVRDCGRYRCRHLIVETDAHLSSELHRPVYHALAPPVR